MQRVAQNVQAVKKPSTKSVAYLISKFSPCFPSSQWWVSYRNTVGSPSSGFDTVYIDHAPDALLFAYCYLSWEHEVTQKATKSIYCFKTSFSEYSLHVRWMQCAPMYLKFHAVHGRGRQCLPLPCTACLHNRLVCRHNIYHVINYEHKRIITVLLAKQKIAPWWWFLREPKHVGAIVGILIVFNIPMIL